MINVDEARRCSDPGGNVRRARPRHRGHQDLATIDVERAQRELERGRAVGDGDRVLATAAFGQPLLKLLNERARDQHAALEHTRDGSDLLRSERGLGNRDVDCHTRRIPGMVRAPRRNHARRGDTGMMLELEARFLTARTSQRDC